MRFFYRTLTLLSVAALLAGPLRAQDSAGNICAFEFVPAEGARLIQNDPELVVYERLYNFDTRVAVPIQWIFTCTVNTKRTSQISEIRENARLRNEILHRFELMELTTGVDAAVFSRTRNYEGRRIKTLEAYFATRDIEYRFYILPAGSDGQSLNELAGISYEELAADLRHLLRQGKFNGDVDATITEAEYRIRFYGFAGAALMLAILLGYAAARLLIRRPRPEVNRE